MNFLRRLFGRKSPQELSVHDNRSDEDRQIESEAKTNVSLGAEADRLVAELIQIGQNDGFLSVKAGGKFNSDCENKRARKIGERLNKIGGLRLMKVVWWKVRLALGPGGGDRELDRAWHLIGIGDSGELWLG